MYALDDTRDNILLNFPMHDPTVLLGRMGFCFTLLFGLPLLVLPCRDAFLAVPGQIRHWRADVALSTQYKEVDQRRKEGAHLVINGVDFDVYDPMMVTVDPDKQHGTMLKYGSTDESERVVVIHDDVESIDTSCAGTTCTTHLTDASDQSLRWNFEHMLHYVSTFTLVSVCYAFAISVPGVGFVCSLSGSSMAISIAFIIPSACYLRIRQHKRMNIRFASAWTLLLLSIIAAPVCTQQAVRNAMTYHK